MVPHGGRYGDILEAIGHTPLVEIPRMSPNPDVHIFAKLEMLNPTGSVKDRVAKYLIEDLEARGLLGPESIILEPTSGNTGIALAMIGRRKGYRVALVMPDNVTNERRQMAALYRRGGDRLAGRARLERVDRAGQAPRVQGRAVRDAVPVREPGQHARPLRDHRPRDPRGLPRDRRLRRGPRHVRDADGRLGYLREQKPGVRVVAVEPLPGEKVQGLRSLDEGFIPEIFEPGLIDAKYLVSNEDSIAALRELVFREGIFAGPSCGAVMVAAARVASEMDHGTIVALLPDGGWKYLSAGTFSMALDEMGDALEGGVNWW